VPAHVVARSIGCKESEMRSFKGLHGASNERSLRVEAGQVVCPRRGGVDIEECWACPDYRGLGTGRVETLMCGMSTNSLATALWALDREPARDA
jgi:hypothetical protein